MTAFIIRALEMSDLDDVTTLLNAETVRWGTFRLPYQSRESIRQRLETFGVDDYPLVAELTADKRVVAMAGIHRERGRRAHAAEFGISVLDDYHGQGIGTALLVALLDLADNWLNLKRLELKVFIDNASAIHLYEKFGFVTEGTFRQYAFRDGVYMDVYFMARLKR